MSLKITTSTELKPEFEYITNVIFAEILGLAYEIVYTEHEEKTTIQLPNKNKLDFTNVFFKAYKGPEDYLKKAEVPDSIENSSFAIGIENLSTYPVIYGNTTIEIDKNKIGCGLDIFGSAYFMLSRWEEYVNPEHDFHNRFPSQESLAVKNGFINRPIVNEYIELLWKFLIQLGYEGHRKTQDFEIVPTHDIDELFFWTIKNRLKYPFKIIRSFRRNADFRAGELTRSFISSMFNRKNDPYFRSAERFIEKNQVKKYSPIYFFISGGNSKYEGFYSTENKTVKTILEKLEKKNQQIGIHPSYYTSESEKMLKVEIESLNNSLLKPIQFSRQHYLRFKLPETFRILQEQDIQIDSSLYYSDSPGFRSGICQTYPLFDFIERKMLDIHELPLTLMDTSLEDKSIEESEAILTDLFQKVKMHNGKFVFLWHNSSTYWFHWQHVEELFTRHFYENN